jgi:hypothetical protein
MAAGARGVAVAVSLTLALRLVITHGRNEEAVSTAFLTPTLSLLFTGKRAHIFRDGFDEP